MTTRPTVLFLCVHNAGRSQMAVVGNLLDNALTHGAPPVAVAVTGDAAWIRLEVADRGPGMSEDLLTTATERFARAPEARSRAGAGFGLAIVLGVVEQAGGELRLCHGGRHTSYGVSSPVPRRHGAGMHTSVFLPRVSSPSSA